MDVQTILATAVFMVFAFGYGACFGSFLNVIVYRLPRGLPILVARSHCPKCKRELLGRDNIPILGWWRLSGKCRFCGLPISLRYPLVETAVGLLFLLLFTAIVVAHGFTLPTGWPGGHIGNWLTEFPGCQLWIVLLQQLILGYTLLSLALIDEDRQRCPFRWPLFVLLTGVAMLWWEPAIVQLDQLSLMATELRAPQADLNFALIYSGLGGLLAGLFGGIARLLKVPHSPMNFGQSLLLVGVYLGPVFLLWTAIIATASLLMQWLLTRKVPQGKSRQTGGSLQVFLAWLLILLSWKWWPLIAVPVPTGT